MLDHTSKPTLTVPSKNILKRNKPNALDYWRDKPLKLHDCILHIGLSHSHQLRGGGQMNKTDSQVMAKIQITLTRTRKTKIINPEIEELDYYVYHSQVYIETKDPVKGKRRKTLVVFSGRRIPVLVLEGGTIFSTRIRLKAGIRRLAIEYPKPMDCS